MLPHTTRFKLFADARSIGQNGLMETTYFLLKRKPVDFTRLPEVYFMSNLIKDYDFYLFLL